LLTLIDQTTDDYARIGLARIGQQEFRGTPIAAESRRQLALAAARIAQRLTIEIRRRLGETPAAARRALFLNHPGLDRFNRLGVVFDYDPVDDQLVIPGPTSP
jgi:hypothetical protein